MLDYFLRLSVVFPQRAMLRLILVVSLAGALCSAGVYLVPSTWPACALFVRGLLRVLLECALPALRVRYFIRVRSVFGPKVRSVRPHVLGFRPHVPVFRPHVPVFRPHVPDFDPHVL